MSGWRSELDKGAFSGDDEGVVPVLALAGPPQTSSLDMLLMAEWEDRAEQGLFRYDVTACPCKVLPGPYGFVAQCNEGRASKKRPTEFRIDQARPNGPLLLLPTGPSITEHEPSPLVRTREYAWQGPRSSSSEPSFRAAQS